MSEQHQIRRARANWYLALLLSASGLLAGTDARAAECSKASQDTLEKDVVALNIVWPAGEKFPAETIEEIDEYFKNRLTTLLDESGTKLCILTSEVIPALKRSDIYDITKIRQILKDQTRDRGGEGETVLEKIKARNIRYLVLAKIRTAGSFLLQFLAIDLNDPDFRQEPQDPVRNTALDALADDALPVIARTVDRLRQPPERQQVRIFIGCIADQTNDRTWGETRIADGIKLFPEQLFEKLQGHFDKRKFTVSLLNTDKCGQNDLIRSMNNRWKAWFIWSGQIAAPSATALMTSIQFLDSKRYAAHPNVNEWIGVDPKQLPEKVAPWIIDKWSSYLRKPEIASFWGELLVIDEAGTKTDRSVEKPNRR